jgi:hypothetical protein
MRKQSALLVLGVAAAAATSSAFAQTRFTATQICSKPDPQQFIAVGDRPDHSLGVVQYRCHWTKPLQLGTDTGTEGISTASIETIGSISHSRGLHVSTMQSGDKVFVAYRSTDTSKAGAAPISKGTWAFTGGTGNLAGIKGKGRFTCAPANDELSCEVEGGYQLSRSRSVKIHPAGP